MIKTLYFDKQIIVCEKPVGILSQADESRGKNMQDLLKKETGSFYIGTVHRLDRPVGGVMVYARNSKAAGILSEDVKAHRFLKEYYAVVHGQPEMPCGVYRDFLFKDRERCKSFVVKTLRKGAKEAELSFEMLETVGVGDSQISLIKIRLKTGRTHQIRVQFSSRGMPLVGDSKYGGNADRCDMALFSHKIGFSHPKTKKPMEFELDPPNTFPWNRFSFFKDRQTEV